MATVALLLYKEKQPQFPIFYIKIGPPWKKCDSSPATVGPPWYFFMLTEKYMGILALRLCGSLGFMLLLEKVQNDGIGSRHTHFLWF